MPDLAPQLESLLRGGVASRAELQSRLSVSQPTLSRTIARMGERVVRVGDGRSARYGLRRELPHIGSSWPVFQISERGEPERRGSLIALARDQYCLAPASDRGGELSDGLPFFLQDLWPQGFIGRTVPKRFPELALPARIADWNDTHALAYLSLRGEDCVGNVLLGEESLQRFLRRLQLPQAHVAQNARQESYPSLADSAIAGTPAGSSAGGEHPKFTAAVRVGSAVRNVLVKFSPAGTDRVSRRWSDLLVAEHLAGKALHEFGVITCVSEPIPAGNRMFLESERFDRVGERGRIGIVSLAAVADHYIGRRDNWTAAMNSLRAAGHVSAADCETVRRAATFGQLIGNSDMHFGNLSFYFSFGQPLSLAPIYDMLPMTYAPVAADELPDRPFEPPLPNAGNLDIWKSVAECAEAYWRDVAAHRLVSREFAAQASGNAASIAQARKLVP